jgi:hypothetical protein
MFVQCFLIIVNFLKAVVGMLERDGDPSSRSDALSAKAVTDGFYLIPTSDPVVWTATPAIGEH